MAIIKLFARLTKLGWRQEEELRELVTRMQHFMAVSGVHVLVGLHIMSEVVVDMNAPSHGQSLSQHRRVAIAFRSAQVIIFFTAMQKQSEANLPLWNIS